MTTIVDGYNLIFGMGWQGKSQHSLALERARERLVRELADLIPVDSRGDITIVFDAKRSPIKETRADSQVNGFRVIFAANYDEADTLIEELIAKHSAPKTLTVVSDDNRLQTAARRRKAIPMACESWLERLNHSVTRGPDASDGESAKSQAIRQLQETDWLAEFQFEDEPTKPNSPIQKQPDTFNPFPPGYGEDLLD